MYHFRPFTNSDPPAIAEVWRSQPPLRGRVQTVTAQLLEVCVFSKQYFDPNALLVATRDDEPVGFVHVGFGPNADGTAIDTDVGVIEMLMLQASLDDRALEDELLRRGEEHLRSRGARRLLGGGRQPMSQFYLGMYGGAELPGVLESDKLLNDLFTRNGYTPLERVDIMHRELASFRPPVSRASRRLRREVDIRLLNSSGGRTWWDASLHSDQEVFSFEMVNRADGRVLSRIGCWDIEPLASSWGAAAIGLIDLLTVPDQQRQGLATYLLAEAFRELRLRGASVAEVQIGTENQAARSLAEKLGMTRIDGGLVYAGPSDG